MVKEEGLITAATPLKAWVKTVQSSACETCPDNSSCEIRRQKKEMHVEVKNTLGVNKGDHVIIGFQTKSLLSLTFLLYVFPIILLIAGALAGDFAAPFLKTDKTLTAIFSGFLLFLAAFITIKRVNSKVSEKWQYRPFLVKVSNKKQL